MRVAIVAEYYPRAGDPVLGVWAHRQALAAREAGADVRVLVLHRPVPPRAALRTPPPPPPPRPPAGPPRWSAPSATPCAPTSTASRSPTPPSSPRRGRAATGA